MSKNTKIIGAFVGIALVIVTGITGYQYLSPSEASVDEKVQRALKNHTVRQIDYWEKIQRIPEVDPIVMVDAAMLEYLALTNYSQGFDQEPTFASEATENFFDLMMLLNDTYKSLPDSIRSKLADKLMGISFVDNLGSSALTIHLFDGTKIAGAAIFIDASWLSKPSNEWMTGKEMSVFNNQGSQSVRVTISEDPEDKFGASVRYLLLHEIAHVLEVNDDRFFVYAEGEPESFESFEFTKISWLKKDGLTLSRKEDAFAFRSKLLFYNSRKSAISRRDIPKVYKQLKDSDFPTLYAATNFNDDFAETFANYLHTIVYHAPYKIEILEGTKVVETMGHCWEEDRCAKKRKFIEAYLNEAPSQAH